jgi:hypothetical protein
MSGRDGTYAFAPRGWHLGGEHACEVTLLW